MLIAVILGTALLSASPKDTGPVYEEVVAGDFKISLLSAKSVYSLEEELDFTIHIEYMGEEPSATISHASSIYILSLKRDGEYLYKIGEEKIDRVFADVMKHTEIYSDKPLEWKRGCAYDLEKVDYSSRPGKYTVEAHFEFTPENGDRIRETLELPFRIAK